MARRQRRGGRLLEADGALDALELTGGSSLANPMYLFRGEAPLPEFAATLPPAARLGFRLVGRRFLPDYPFEEAFFLPYARQFRDALSMPLILLGGITRLDTVERALAEGFAFVAMARALLREPDLVARMQAGTASDVAVHPLQQVHAHHLPRHPLRPGRRETPAEDRTTVRAMPLHVHETDSATDQLLVRPQTSPQLGEISEVPELGLAPAGCRPTPPTRSSTTSCCWTATPGSTWPPFVTTWMERDADSLMAECSAKHMMTRTSTR